MVIMSAGDPYREPQLRRRGDRAVDARLDGLEGGTSLGAHSHSSSSTGGTLNAGTAIGSGTLADDRLSTNVALLDSVQTITGAKTMNSASNVLHGNGANLTALNAWALSSGLVPSARLGTPQMIVTGINGKSASATPIGTTATGRGLFVCTNIDVIAEALNTPTGLPVASVGTNSTDYDNLVATTALTELIAVNSVMALCTGLIAVAANTGIYINISVAGTGDTLTLTVVINGYYLGA